MDPNSTYQDDSDKQPFSSQENFSENSNFDDEAVYEKPLELPGAIQTLINMVNHKKLTWKIIGKNGWTSLDTLVDKLLKEHKCDFTFKQWCKSQGHPTDRIKLPLYHFIPVPEPSIKHIPMVDELIPFFADTNVLMTYSGVQKAIQKIVNVVGMSQEVKGIIQKFFDRTINKTQNCKYAEVDTFWKDVERDSSSGLKALVDMFKEANTIEDGRKIDEIVEKYSFPKIDNIDYVERKLLSGDVGLAKVFAKLCQDIWITDISGDDVYMWSKKKDLGVFST